ncbi:LPXTG-motif cell wall-anchored protein [Salirhabdus euzebyi]|uniref:LPXTG-motif cell wall-anchored protein n=1 Tax=Salirhabdus euzebyi TaxID=394506 RepID=A0A841Q5S2_9BACI|nr:immunoglobulin-like domain-containing protein [Salirhabdus euzebyi]MBB6453735.1 LPXTG-motif cell wall-anchored protein [Salirhabdus euzebyi]
MKIKKLLVITIVLILGFFLIPQESNANSTSPPDPTDTPIVDEELKKAINATLTKPSTYNPTVADLQSSSFTKLEASYTNIQNLEGLQYATNLKILRLYGNEISDISQLSSLTKLTFINLSRNNIVDVTPISTLPDLESLTLSNNDITTAEPLKDLPNLRTLYLAGCMNLNYSTVSSLTQVQSLYLSQNNISDLSFLSNLTNLTSLALNSNDISDLTPLNSLINLKSLTVGWNSLSDLSHAADLIDQLTNFSAKNQTIELPAIDLHVAEDTLQMENQITDVDGNIISATITPNQSGVYNHPIISWAGLNSQDSDDIIRSYEFDYTFNNGEFDHNGTVVQPINWVEESVPVINADNKTIVVWDYFDPKDDVTASDKEDGELTDQIQVVKNEVDVSKPGEYEVTYSVLDSDDNQTEKTITITVIGNEAPVIHASDLTLLVGDDFDPFAGVTASDKEDGDLTDRVQIDKNEVDTSTPGDYEVTYTVFDSKEKLTTKTITVTVVENTPPHIEASDQTITVGDSFDPLADVKATDTEDGDLTNKINVAKNEVNTDKPGVYEVTYQVTDSNGLMTAKTITVTVKALPAEEPKDEPKEDKDPEEPEEPEEDEDTLPQTGEEALYLFTIAGLALIGIGIFFIRRRFN